MTRITGTFLEDLRTFTISRWILLRQKYYRQIGRQKQNTHFMFNNHFPKIVPFVI